MNIGLIAASTLTAGIPDVHVLKVEEPVASGRWSASGLMMEESIIYRIEEEDRSRVATHCWIWLR